MDFYHSQETIQELEKGKGQLEIDDLGASLSGVYMMGMSVF